MPDVPNGEIKILKKLKDHYTACMDEALVAKQGLKPLKATTEKIKDLMGKHDPVLPGDRSSFQVSTTAHAFDVEALTDTMAFLAEIGVPALINFYVAVSSQNLRLL
jgi:predicted metalloendopeptidase